MKFLSLYQSAEGSAPYSTEERERMGRPIEEGTKAGDLLAVAGCLASALGASVRKSDGKISVTDGPFTESKEVIGGLAIGKRGLSAEAREEYAHNGAISDSEPGRPAF